MIKCFGCGIKLQDKDETLVGYTSDLNKSLCERCFKLKNYGKYINVTLNNEDYLNIINSIPASDLVIYVTDILNLSINNIERFKNVIIVVTKRDILPKTIKDSKIINYIKNRYDNILDVVVISSVKNYNLDNLYNKIINYSNNNIAYFMGNTNSGKSTLLNKLIDNYGTNDTKRVTTSMYPSTTLDKIEINIENLKLIDTPGLLDDGNIINKLEQKEIKNITCKKEINPKSCQVKPGKGSIIIDKFVRIDYETNLSNSFIIYASNSLDIRFSSIKKEVDKTFCKKVFELDSKKDIVIPGLGFIKFVDPIKIKIYCKDYVKPYSRDNLI